jgi:hypothetical protein
MLSLKMVEKQSQWHYMDESHCESSLNSFFISLYGKIPSYLVLPFYKSSSK